MIMSRSCMCHGQTFCIVYNAIFNYQFDLFYCARRAGATGRKCTMTINARHASGCGLVAIFGIIVWESARVFVNRWSGGYFYLDPIYVWTCWMYRSIVTSILQGMSWLNCRQYDFEPREGLH